MSDANDHDSSCLCCKQGVALCLYFTRSAMHAYIQAYLCAGQRKQHACMVDSFQTGDLAFLWDAGGAGGDTELIISSVLDLL
jgi:hypothetical protein